MIICVDFDGVIVKHRNEGVGRYGELIKDSEKALRALKAFGHKIIINTCRHEPSELQVFLQANAVPYDWINYCPENDPIHHSQKPLADIYIDDKALCFNGEWSEEFVSEILNFKRWEKRTIISPKAKQAAVLNKTAVITGASSGLGKVISIHLYRKGYRVFNLSDVPPKYESCLSTFIECDITCRRQIKAAVKKVELLGECEIDVLVNNAGINLINFLEEVSEEEWDKVIDTNAKGIYMVSREFLPHLKATSGTIVNVISNASHTPMTSSIAYNASKGAAHIMTKQMARELTKSHNITVFGIAPNKLHSTGMSERIDAQVCQTRGWTKEYAKEYQLKALPAGKETDPDKIAELLGFLLEFKERHDYLTGCILECGA